MDTNVIHHPYVLRVEAKRSRYTVMMTPTNQPSILAAHADACLMRSLFGIEATRWAAWTNRASFWHTAARSTEPSRF
jgi:hypothetical protein